MRIRWRGVARVAALIVVVLIALRTLPGLLHAPEPPPLAPDVGLPKAKPVRDAPVEVAEKSRPQRHRPHEARRPKTVADAPASTAVMGTGRRHRKSRKARKARSAPVESAPPPAPEYIAPPPPEVVPEATFVAPAAPPPTPGDGSEEFAPH